MQLPPIVADRLVALALSARQKYARFGRGAIVVEDLTEEGDDESLVRFLYLTEDNLRKAGIAVTPYDPETEFRVVIVEDGVSGCETLGSFTLRHDEALENQQG